MKVIHLCLAVIVFSALVVILNAEALSSNIEKQLQNKSIRTLSVKTLSPTGPAVTPPRQNKQNSQVASPRIKCKTAMVDLGGGPNQNPADSAVRNWKTIEDGNVLRIIPNPVIPERSRKISTRSNNGSLDQGSDLCPATVIPSLPYTDTGTTYNKADNFAPSCAQGYTSPDVIYQYTAAQTVTHAVSVTGRISYFGCLSVRTGGVCPGNTEIGCKNASYNNDLYLALELSAGETYYFIVDLNHYDGDSYTINVTASSTCNPDFDLAAPGSVAGNTCFAANNCTLGESEDQMVRVTIPYSSRWQFGLCDNEMWYATILLTANCCGDSIIAESSYGCEYDNGWYMSRPMIRPIYLAAGVYYLDIEGYRDGECGVWTLTVDELPPCTSRPDNDMCENAGPPATLPVTFSGDNTCATHDCDSLTRGQGETWHAFIISEPSDVVIDFCNSPTHMGSIYQVLATGCPCQHLIHATEHTYNTSCTEWWYQEYLFFHNLQAGVYYYPVLRDSIYEREGPYLVHISAMPSCTIESQPGDIFECLDYPDSVALGIDCNKGCNSNGEGFQRIEIGQTVFGRTFSYYSDNYLSPESDWYSFTLSDTATMTISITAECPIRVGLYDYNCPYVASYISSSYLFPCSTLTITSNCMRPNTYAILVQHDWFMQSTAFKSYRLTVNSTPCEWSCFLTQEPGDQLENETICYDGYHDEYNPGCGGGNGNFQEIACGDTILGSSGLFRTGNDLYCDMDWFHFTTTENSIITLSVIAEFEPYLIIADYCPGCDGGLAETSGPNCSVVTASTNRCYPPGNYYVSVFPANGLTLPCGTLYRMWVSCDPCAPCPDLYQIGDLIENEPPCSTWVNYWDHFNGGCNSTPPAFSTEISCGQSIWGKSGTWYGNYGNEKDTDWLKFTLNQSATPTFKVVAQFPVMTAIVGPSNPNSCDSVLLYSEVVTGNACDTVVTTTNEPLTAGTYWYYIAPNTIYGVLCGSEYRAWSTCGPCLPDTVRNVTIRRIGNDIVLRWDADPTFTGTYMVYHSASDPDDEGGNWEPLTVNIAPVQGRNRTTFRHADAVLSSENSQYYIVVGVCP